MWTAQLSYTAVDLAPQPRHDLASALRGQVDYDPNLGLILTFRIEGATLRQAADNALREAASAVLSAAHGLVPAKPTRLHLMPTEEYIASLEHPPALDQSGIAEIADMFGVSRQRAWQLVDRPGFPAPVSRLKAGPVFSTASVAAFHRRWLKTRNPQGGRPPKSASVVAAHDNNNIPESITTSERQES